MRPRLALMTFFAVAGVWIASAIIACDDYLPLRVQGRVIDAGDLAPIDASPEALQACGDCIVQNCLRLCETDTVCQDAVGCSIANGCLYGRSQIGSLDCARPCLDDAGYVSGPQNPTTNRLLGTSQCALDRCTDTCKPTN